MKPKSRLRRMYRDDPVTPTAKAEVLTRSRGYCEARAAADCTGHFEHRHHRQLRRHGDHRAVNLLGVCHRCHGYIHAHPAISYVMGWLVKGHEDPADIRFVLGPFIASAVPTITGSEA